MSPTAHFFPVPDTVTDFFKPGTMASNFDAFATVYYCVVQLGLVDGGGKGGIPS